MLYRTGSPHQRPIAISAASSLWKSYSLFYSERKKNSETVPGFWRKNYLMATVDWKSVFVNCLHSKRGLHWTASSRFSDVTAVRAILSGYSLSWRFCQQVSLKFHLLLIFWAPMKFWVNMFAFPYPFQFFPTLSMPSASFREQESAPRIFFDVLTHFFGISADVRSA